MQHVKATPSALTASMKRDVSPQIQALTAGNMTVMNLDAMQQMAVHGATATGRAAGEHHQAAHVQHLQDIMVKHARGMLLTAIAMSRAAGIMVIQPHAHPITALGNMVIVLTHGVMTGAIQMLQHV